MRFKVDDRVVYPAFGIGRVVALVTKAIGAAESRLYYEVSGGRSTVWVQADGDAGSGLRPLTRKDELAHFRNVLRGRPARLNTDFRLRQLEVRGQLRLGTLQAVCEVVRDLSARRWVKPLSETESDALRQGSDRLCCEWAAADGVSLPEAATEVNALLAEGRRAFSAGSPPA